jgi:hypothetical protein
MRQSPTVPLAELDVGGVARCLAQITDPASDRVEAFFEVSEEVRLDPAGPPPALSVRREAGLAVRLVRGPRSWLASADRIDRQSFEDTLLRVARVRPAARAPVPLLACGPLPGEEARALLQRFPDLVAERVRSRHAAFPFVLVLGRHRRWLRVVGALLAPEPERESFWSCVARCPWGRWGGLFPELDESAADRVASALVGLFRSRDASSPPPGRVPVVLGPAAAAVLLHEAVAHALESDVADFGGTAPRRGERLGSRSLSVVDDPGTGPAAVRRATDDEGAPATRRFLLREGVVDQPLADLASAADSEALLPGAARRSSRHAAPVPRSTHLELVAGERPEAALVAGASGGLFVPEAARGRLDPASGRFRLDVAHARRIGAGGAEEAVGPFRLSGRVEEILGGVAEVGAQASPVPGGWCAKGGLKVPVWSTAAALRLEAVEVRP